nr:uncharacterized protein LOC111999833 [Quercus suber]
MGTKASYAWRSIMVAQKVVQHGYRWQLATNLLEEYRLANHQIMIPNVATHTTWTPPHNPWYKVNVDGAVFQHLDAVGIGVVAWDHSGQCMVAMSKKLWVPLGPLEAEAKAMEEGIDFAWDVGLRDVVFETDFELLHRSLTGSITPPATIQNIVNSCIMRLQDFRAVQLTHIRRNGNKPAHLLSQHAKGLETFATWIENIESALTQDVLF